MRAPLGLDLVDALSRQGVVSRLSNEYGVLRLFFSIVGGLYSVTALRKNNNESDSVY